MRLGILQSDILKYPNLPIVRSFALDDPRGFLAQFPKGAILDEVQRCPELPSYLHGLIDLEPGAGRWILTGSQNLMLLQSIGQSLAGRAAILHLLAADCGISQPTARAWMSVLEASFIVFRLPAFSSNVSKRLIKMPKLHFYDTGLVCWLLGIRDHRQLRTHPMRGAVLETWVVSEIIKHRANDGERGGVFFYRDQHAAEGDLIVESGTGLTLVEAKAGETASSGFFESARRVRDVLQSVAKVSAFVAFGGEARQTRKGIALMPWCTIHEHRWA